MTHNNMTMFIIFLRFGPNRTQASQWMVGHKQWIQDGIADGSFLMAGSLDSALGGVVIATGRDDDAIHARLAQDPFVMHSVVSVEVHAVTPSLMAKGLDALLHCLQAGQEAS